MLSFANQIGFKAVRSILPTHKLPSFSSVASSTITSSTTSFKSSSSSSAIPLFEKNWLNIYREFKKFSTSLEVNIQTKKNIDVNDSLFYHPIPGQPLQHQLPPADILKKNNKGVVDVLKANEIQVLNENSVPLIRPEEVTKAIKVLQKEKILIQGVTLWKKEADIFFEIYWKKGLHLDDAIREMKSKARHSNSTNNNTNPHLINFCAQKSMEFVTKMSKDPECSNIEYFGIVPH